MSTILHKWTKIWYEISVSSNELAPRQSLTGESKGTGPMDPIFSSIMFLFEHNCNKT